MHLKRQYHAGNSQRCGRRTLANRARHLFEAHCRAHGVALGACRAGPWPGSCELATVANELGLKPYNRWTEETTHASLGGDTVG
eukprot:249417-Prymnesium_polylepis.3